MPTRNINSDLNVTSDLTVAGEVEFSGLSTASVSPFVVSDEGNLGTRTTAQVLGDIAALPLAGGTMTGILTFDGSSSADSSIDQSSGYLQLIGNAGSTATGARMWIGAGTTDAGFYVNAAQHFFRDQSSNTRLYVAGGGNVGIGTTSPTDTLDVDGGIRLSTSGRIQGRSYPYTTNIGSGANATTTNITAGSTDKSEISLVGGDVGDRIEFKTNSTERMRIDASGNVGIGTTSPSVDLHVNSSNNIGFKLQHASRPTIQLTDGTNSGYVGLDSGSSIITGTSDNDLAIRSPRNIVFGGNSIARMSITNAGNVGIGTTSPAQKLTVEGGSALLNTPSDHQRLFITSSPSHQSIIYFGDSDTSTQGRVAYNNSSDLLYFNTNGSTKMTILSGGNVGIGTGSPSYPLEVAGAGTVSIAYQRTGVTGPKKWGFHSDSSNTYWQNLTDNVLALTVSNAGNVGIGTASPARKLHVSTGNTDVAARFENTTSNGNVIEVKTSGDNKILNIQTDHIYSNTALHLGSDSYNTYIRGAKVGIGTTSPTTALTIRKAISSAAYGAQASMIEFKSYFTGYDTETVKSAIYSGVSDTGSLDTRGGYMSFHVNNNGTMGEKLRIDKSGSVGIGKLMKKLNRMILAL